MKKVIIYSGEGCPYCNIAKDFFKEKNIEFTEHNITEDLESKKFLISKRIMSIPYIVIDDVGFKGFNEEDILLELNK